MRQSKLLVVLVVVVGMLVVPAAGAMAQETDDDEGDDISPGERLSGVVGVQSAEFDGEIERNAFRIGLERADDNATKARHIAEKLNESERRMAELQERKTELDQQRENDTISEGRYRAQMARIATETRTVEHQLNDSNATAERLPRETLEANGVNTTALNTLRNSASEMRGGEVAEIARSIAGNRSGMVDRGPPADVGPDADRGGDGGPADNQTGAQTGQDTDIGQSGAENRTAGGDRGNTDDMDTDETDSGSANGQGGADARNNNIGALYH